MRTSRAARLTTVAPDSAFGKLLAENPEAVARPVAGDVVRGVLLDRAPHFLYVDLGPAGVGIVYGRELLDAGETFEQARVGDPVEAVVLDPENADGYLELSLRSATKEKSWEELASKLASGEIFPVQILDANKGGLIVRISGVTGFLPVSQLSTTHYPRVEGGEKQKIFERLRSYVGTHFNVRVITADVAADKLIVSEKAAMTPEMEVALGALKEGTVVEGAVSGTTDFGIFIKFPWQSQDLEGLVHISELAWQRVDDPNDYVKVGQKVKALVIGVDGTRISLSFKRLREDPWLTAEKKYVVGQEVEGEVLKLTPFGAFVKLDEDIHGLAHVTELSEKEETLPEQVLRVGERKRFRIISLEPAEHRLGLSLRPDALPRAKKKTARRPAKSRGEPSAEETPAQKNSPT